MRNLTILLTFFSILYFPEKSSALEERDSLRDLFYNLEEIENVDSLLNARLELIQLVRRSDYSLYLEFAQKNIELAQKYNINWGLVDIYMEMGGSFIEKGNYSIALNYLNQAYEYALKDEYRPYIGWVTLEIGNCYETMLRYKRAIDFYQISLKVFEETKEPEGIALASTNIGINYLNLNNFENAEKYLNTGLEKWKELNDLVELGYVQMYLANLQIKQQNYKQAVQDLTILIQDINRNDGGISNGFRFVEGKTLTGRVYSLLSECYKCMNSVKQKYQALSEAGKVFYELKDSLNLSEVLNSIAENYFDDKQFENAILYADSALNITEGSMVLNQQARANKLLSDSYSEINNKSLSLEYYQKYHLIQDSMFNQSVIEAISNVDVLIQTIEQEKDNEILQLNVFSERRLRIIITLGAVAFLVILLIALLSIFLKLQKVKQLNDELYKKNRKIAEQTKSLETLNNDLTQLVKSKDKFHSVIAHDLKNPVGSNYNISELLARNYEEFTDSERKRLAELSYETSKQTLRLLENLLAWSQIQGGLMQVKKTVFNINKDVEKTIENLLYIAKLKSIDVQFIHDERIEVLADREMLSTIIRNLFSNAVKFTPKGKKIVVGVRRKGTNVEVWVEDEGIGIPLEQVGKLFQVDSNYQRLGTDNENGTGLGLQLSYEFLKLNDGYFEIKSKVNEGSRFAFFIPVYISN